MSDGSLKTKVINFRPESTAPSNPENGDVYYDSGLGKFRAYEDGAWTDVIGGGASGTPTPEEENFYTEGNAEDAEAGDFSTGNDSTFDNGGSLAGTFSITTTASDLINGSQSFKYVQSSTAGDNDDDFIASPAISIPQGYRGRFLKCRFQYKFDGTSGNVKWVIKDETNTAILTDGTETLDKYNDTTNNTARRLELVFYCPADCEEIKVGPQVLTGEADKILIWDDVVISPNAFIQKNLLQHQYAEVSTTAGSASSGTITGQSLTTSFGSGLFDYDSVTGEFTVLKDCIMSLSLYVRRVSGNNAGAAILRDGTTIANDFDTNSSTGMANSAAEVRALEGEVFTFSTLSGFNNFFFSVSAVAESEAVIHYSTEAENIYSGHIENNGSTASIITQSSPNNPAIESVVRNSTGSVSVTFTSNFFNIIPAITAVVTNGGGANGERIDVRNLTTSGFDVLTEDVSGNNQDNDFAVIIHRQDTDYRDPKSSVITPMIQTVYLKDVKANNTNGGTFTSGAWQTRELNTIEGSLGWVSLNSNQFTLQPGKYEITALAPTYSDGSVNRHKAKIRDITNSTDPLIGISSFNGDTGTGTDAIVTGELIISEPTTYELQHQCQTTQSSFGFGIASGFSVDEVYSIVKIIKFK